MPMKTAEAKPTRPVASLQARHQAQPFFQKVGGASVLDNEQTPFFSTRPVVQTKLTIGRPGDRYEQEADQTAENVINRLSEPGSPAIQKKQHSAHPVLPATALIQQQPAQDNILDQEVEAESNEMLRKKPVFESAAPPEDDSEVQRACTGCHEEETVQAKSDGATHPGSIETQLKSTKGSGSPLPANTRSSMEQAFGNDFSGVRVHAGSDAARMNKELGAHAFTHGSDIYFNDGKYATNSKSGQLLLAHELTHTIQQGGAGKSGTTQAKIQRWPDWVSDAAGWVSDTASDAAGAVVEGAEWVGGQVADGARWVGGQVADGASWVGEQISAAAQWVIDRIRSAINSGTDYLTEQWENIKQFGSGCFDTIKNGFGTLVHFVTNPLSSLLSALSAMDADLLGSVWSLLTSGANALWGGINSVINGVLETGAGIWSTVSGFVNGIFNTVAGLFDNSAFDLLPDFIKQEARSILNGLRSLWNQVATFWTDLWQRLTSSVQEILAGVRSFVDNVIGFSIDGVITMVRDLKEVYDYVMKFFADPRATIQPFLDLIAAKLNTEAPPRANALGSQMALENYQGGANPTTADGTIQRQKSDSEERDTASFDEVGKGILYYITQFWAELNIKDMLWQTVVNSFWPPASIKAICKEFSDLWNDHWATTVDSLYTPRNFFDKPYAIGCLHDIWSNFLILLDFPLSLWRTLNHVVGLLIGWVSILVVLGGAAIGGVVGGFASGGPGVIPGLLAGAKAGLGAMMTIGEGLMASYVAAESITVNIILIRLFTARQVCEKRQVDILTSVASFIAMAVALVLQALMALLAELVNLIAGILKGAPRPVPQPQPVAPPAQPGLPPPAPSPIPAPPQPQPVPVQPTVPAQPAAPVIPLRPRPVTPAVPGPQPVPVQPTVPAQPAAPVIPLRPRPVTPAEQPGRIAAKFEDGESHDSLFETGSNKSSAEPADNYDTLAETDSVNGSTALSGMQDAEGGIVQTARKDKIDPDACKEEKCNLPYKWWLQKGATASRLIYCGKNKNFQKHEHHTWPKYLGGPHAGQEPLLPVAERIHSTEFHGNSGPIGPVHKVVQAMLNSNPEYREILDGNDLTKNRSSTGNDLLIKAMKKPGSADLRRQVKNAMLGYYTYYTVKSDPQMPPAAYAVGLGKAENNIQ